MPADFARAYADSVNQDACDEFSADFQALHEALGAVPHELERQFVVFFAELQDAATETRQLIAEIDALTR